MYVAFYSIKVQYQHINLFKVSQEWCFLKPCWLSDKIWWFSRCSMICQYTICSIVLQQMEVNDTGLQFTAWLRSPFLYIAVIFACRQSSGTSPVMSDCLSMMVKKGAISILHASFSILVGIWSGPFALVGSSFFSNVQTQFSVILSWSIDGTEEFPSCGVCSRFSSVKTLSYCLLRISALPLLSIMYSPDKFWSGDFPYCDCLSSWI